jgi:hypothetical protein
MAGGRPDLAFLAAQKSSAKVIFGSWQSTYLPAAHMGRPLPQLARGVLVRGLTPEHHKAASELHSHILSDCI